MENNTQNLTSIDKKEQSQICDHLTGVKECEEFEFGKCPYWWTDGDQSKCSGFEAKEKILTGELTDVLTDALINEFKEEGVTKVDEIAATKAINNVLHQLYIQSRDD